MATLIDERPEDVETEEEVSQIQEEPQVEETPQEEEIPDKYKGKSTAEIVRMHQEAEKRLGKQSGEVGELRSVVDNYIQTQLDTNTPATQEPTLRKPDERSEGSARVQTSPPRYAMTPQTPTRSPRTPDQAAYSSGVHTR